MSAFFKTLFGDLRTIAVVTLVMVVEVVLVASGYVDWASYAVPVCALAGAAWLATE